MVEPVEMKFGMLSRVGLENVYYIGIDASTGRDTFGVFDWLNSIVKYRILGGWVKGWAVQKMGGLILTIYASYNIFLHKELPFRDHVKIYVNFLIAINSLMDLLVH